MFHSIFPDTEYYSIPNLYELDEYDRCLKEDPTLNPVYCYVDSTIKPSSDNHIWQLINVRYLLNSYLLNNFHDLTILFVYRNYQKTKNDSSDMIISNEEYALTGAWKNYQN